jgi:PAS domain S-box-containing protein
MISWRRTAIPGCPGRTWLALGVVAAVVAGDARPADAGPNDRRLVVVIYPEDTDGSPGTVGADHGIRSTFAAEPVEVRNEYVNTSGGIGPEAKRLQVAYLRQKYAGRKIELVIAVLSSALDFTLAHRADLFPGAPVIYCAVDQREIGKRDLPAGVIGVSTRVDFPATLNIARRLHPHARRVFVVAGASPFDTDWADEVRRAFSPYEQGLEFEYLIGLPMNDLLARVAALPDDSLIFYLHIFQDGTGKAFVPAEALELLAARANAPIYGRVDTHVGRGLVGGHVFSFEAEGRSAARLGLRILAGEKPGAMTIPAANGNVDLFDGRQLRRWGIDERDLPPGSVVRFREPTFWGEYRWHVVAVLSVCTVEALLIAGLLVQRVRRRRSDAALRESEARFRLMADAAPVLVWVAGVDKGGTYFNRPWLEFTGRSLDLELGDGWAAGIHPDDRARCLDVYATCFDAREPFEMVYRLRRHDGEYRWVLDQGVPRFSSGGEFVGYVGAGLDITDRRRTEDELGASQRELRSLAGRLIEAQETERRRIARELHDDLSQDLALLSIELDIVARRPPASTADVVECLRGFSARVRELSAGVRDLSHELHPSKVEHLGLVASVRGLCHELGQHHDLAVTFAHRDVPEGIPVATALCLYRIVQEALNNVIKHAHTDRARVELAGTPRGLRLEVSDDGAGFHPAGRGGGLGLVGMQERLTLIGGQVVVDSRSGGGTRINVKVPLPESVAASKEASAGRPAEADLVTAGPTAEEVP